MDRDGASRYYYFDRPFYMSILSSLKCNSKIFYATHGGKVISMALILFDNQNMHYHLSASNPKFNHLAATNLLLYEAACWGSENGYKYFHLGGGLGSARDSLLKFKEAFNKNSETSFSIGTRVFDNKKYENLVTLRNETVGSNNSTGFFPISRDRLK